jgi:hypothetical protein
MPTAARSLSDERCGAGRGMAQSRCRKWRHLNRGPAWRARKRRISPIFVIPTATNSSGLLVRLPDLELRTASKGGPRTDLKLPSYPRSPAGIDPVGDPQPSPWQCVFMPLSGPRLIGSQHKQVMGNCDTLQYRADRWRPPSKSKRFRQPGVACSRSRDARSLP